MTEIVIPNAILSASESATCWLNVSALAHDAAAAGAADCWCVRAPVSVVALTVALGAVVVAMAVE